jgi:2-hydroxychromene-2-carboxylate isomerase
MTIEVDFFFGPASRYSYLASTQLSALEAASGCRFHWRALFSGDLLAGRGYNPFHGQPVSGQYEWSYRQHDAAAWAAFYGVPFREPPAELVEGETVPRRLALACTAAARLGAGVAYASRLFLAVFAEPPGRFDDDRLGAFASDVGLGQEALVAALAEPATAAALQATTREALQRGAFGVPTFFVGERMYWGNDRLVLLQHHLTSLANQGRSSPDCT